MVWDEVRDHSPEHAADFREQVKLHRRHPSICIVSHCNNEEECCQFDIAQAGRSFRDAARELDPNRPLSGNYKVAECGMTNASQKPYAIGVWSMLDCFGEACSAKNVLNETGPGPHSDWPAVFGTFGNVDIAGFAKPSAWWHRVN